MCIYIYICIYVYTGICDIYIVCVCVYLSLSLSLYIYIYTHIERERYIDAPRYHPHTTKLVLIEFLCLCHVHACCVYVMYTCMCV